MKALLLPVLLFGAINILEVSLGYVLYRRKYVALSWVMMVAGIAAVYLLFQHQHPVVKMLAIIATTFTGMKVVAAAASNQQKAFHLSLVQWLAFAIGWAGMRAQPFETLGDPALPNAGSMIRFGITRVVGGTLLIFLARSLTLLTIGHTLQYIVVSLLLLVGFSLILHFGLLSIGAGMWRLSGVNTYYLFRQPATATSLNEFWSKRWNLAFSEMTSITLFRPLKGRIGQAGALMVSFLFSGVLHELALSMPVNAGYGLPMLYFTIQALAVIAERSLSRDPHSFVHGNIAARVWVFFWLVVPAPLLFHSRFISELVWPLAGL